MTNSFTTKRAVIINTIAITTALAVISGYSPLHQLPIQQLQSLLQPNMLINQATNR